MQKNELINIKNIPASSQTESAYKNFPIPQIFYKPNNKIYLLPRKKFAKKINIEFIINGINKNKKDKENKEDTIDITKKNVNKEICISEEKRIKKENSIHNVIINSENYPNLKSLSYKQKAKINNLRLKPKNNNLNIHITDSNNSKKDFINLKLKENLPKINNVFRVRISKIKEKPLEIINQNNSNDENVRNKRNDIFKSTEVFPIIKLGCKYNIEDRNTLEEEENIEFNAKLRKMLNNIYKLKKKSRNINSKNCYEILADIKRKKTYDCEKLIEKTSEDVKNYQEKIKKVYTNLKKTLEENDEWNSNIDKIYDLN